MNYRILADLVVFLHFFFVVFAPFGAFPALKWQKTMWIQLSAAPWAMAVDYAHRPCPTPVEKWLVQKERFEVGRGSFAEHPMLPLVYPDRLGNSTGIILGTIGLLLNVGIYRNILRRSRKNILE